MAPDSWGGTDWTLEANPRLALQRGVAASVSPAALLSPPLSPPLLLLVRKMTVGKSAGAPECAKWSREVSGERRKQDASERNSQEGKLFGVAVETESGACHRRAWNYNYLCLDVEGLCLGDLNHLLHVPDSDIGERSNNKPRINLENIKVISSFM